MNNPYTILFVEYVTDILLSGTELFRGLGHRVVPKKNMCGVSDKDYSTSDCILAHPPMNGKEIERLRKLMDKYPQTGVILNTGKDEGKGGIYSKLETDIRGTIFLTKPYDYEDLVEAMDKAVEQAKERASH